MTEYGRRRPYTASGQGAAQDRVSYNLSKAESLLDEPETGFSMGANYGGPTYGAGGSGSGGNSGMGSGIGRLGTAGQASNLVGSYAGAGRSNYTASEIADSETHSQVQARPRWGNQPGESYGGGGLAGITEIGTVEVAGSRRSGRFAGGGTSQGSNSQYN